MYDRIVCSGQSLTVTAPRSRSAPRTRPKVAKTPKCPRGTRDPGPTCRRDEILTPQSVAKTPWEKALSRLPAEDLGEIDLTAPGTETQLAILHLFVQETTITRDACEARQWRFANQDGEQILLRDRINTLVTTLAKYTAVVDFVVQPLPSVVGLAWGGFKLLLQAATADLENTALAMESLDALARVLANCGVYERLYGGDDLVTAAGMQEALVALYVLVLRYLCYLKKHLGRNTAGEDTVCVCRRDGTDWECGSERI